MTTRPPEQRLPDEVRQLAIGLGAVPGAPFRFVHLRQSGRLRTDVRSRWMRFSATQEIALPEPGFCWRARVGPFGAIRVVDELDQGMPAGSVSLFDRIRLGQSHFSPALLKGELMRYLAELAWAPDAMIANDSLRWDMIRSDRIAVSADRGPVSARVVMSIDPLGRITGIDAADRPRLEYGRFIERPWRGVFGTYRSVSGRLFPHQAEVSWQIDGHFEPVWIGELTSWRLR